jgi:hypothetical protein
MSVTGFDSMQTRCKAFYETRAFDVAADVHFGGLVGYMLYVTLIQMLFSEVVH